MIEAVFITTLLVCAIVLAIRPLYRAVTEKEQGCANCPKCCGHANTCVYGQEKHS